MTFSVVVLSGGSARRLGRDKASTPINGITMIERVLRPFSNDVEVIVVGESVDTVTREVIFTREDPVGTGPLAALAAGLRHVTNDKFLLLATDIPFVGEFGLKLLKILDDVTPGIDAIIPSDKEGKLQPLCAAYRSESVRGACTRIGNLTNGSMKRLIAELQYESYDQQDAWALSDVDTVQDLEDARKHARIIEGARSMDEWIADVIAALDLKVDVNVDLLLDVARDAAHNVTRPAAPITTYLLGVAVANGADVKIAAAVIQQLATSRNKSQGT